jgi:hypothetical protein
VGIDGFLIILKVSVFVITEDVHIHRDLLFLGLFSNVAETVLLAKDVFKQKEGVRAPEAAVEDISVLVDKAGASEGEYK